MCVHSPPLAQCFTEVYSSDTHTLQKHGLGYNDGRSEGGSDYILGYDQSWCMCATSSGCP